MARGVGVLAAAVGCAVLFGIGIPLLWVWLASQFQTTTGQGIGMLPASLVIVGPLACYIVLVVLAGRFRFSQPPEGQRQPQRMAWNTSRDEIRERARYTTTFEQVVLTSILIVGFGFEVWYFGFAHCSSAMCFG